MRRGRYCKKTQVLANAKYDASYMINYHMKVRNQGKIPRENYSFIYHLQKKKKKKTKKSKQISRFLGKADVKNYTGHTFTCFTRGTGTINWPTS